MNFKEWLKVNEDFGTSDVYRSRIYNPNYMPMRMAHTDAPLLPEPWHGYAQQAIGGIGSGMQSSFLKLMQQAGSSPSPYVTMDTNQKPRESDNEIAFTMFVDKKVAADKNIAKKLAVETLIKNNSEVKDAVQSGEINPNMVRASVKFEGNDKYVIDVVFKKIPAHMRQTQMEPEENEKDI